MAKSQTMRETPRQVLCELIAKYGEALIDEPGRCSGLLRDALSPDPRGPYKTEINLLLTAQEEGVPAALRSRSLVGPMTMQLNRLVQRLRDDRQLNEDAARWAVETWALALGMISIAELSTLDADQKQAPVLLKPTPSPILPNRNNQGLIAAMVVVAFLAGGGIFIKGELDKAEQGRRAEAVEAEQVQKAEIAEARRRAEEAAADAARAKSEARQARREAEAQRHRHRQAELEAQIEAERTLDPETTDPEATGTTGVDESEPTVEQPISPQNNYAEEPLMVAADWGNHIRAHATTKEKCWDAEFSRQGYIHALFVTIPASRMKSETDAWAVINGRALTVVGCWFYKDDGLAHAKMKRKKDGKVWEQDLNFNDGSWSEVAN